MVYSSRQGRRVDVVVVGAGVVGASIAREISCRGASVIVLESFSQLGGGCSYANAALVTPLHVTPLATPAMLREAPIQMMRTPPAFRIRPSARLIPWLGRLALSARRADAIGPLMTDLAIASTELHTDLVRRGLTDLRKTGAVDVYLHRPPTTSSDQRLSAAELKKLEPGISGVVAATYDTEDWILESKGYVKAMLDDARNHGAEVRFGMPVEALHIENGRVRNVSTPAGVIEADNVVLAAGLGTGRLAAQAGINVPLRGGRGYVVDVETPARGGPRRPIRIKDHRIVVTPLADRVRICGSIEFGRENRRVRTRRGEALRRVAAQVIPTLDGQLVIDRWAGERPCTPDGVPIIGLSTRVENLALATGHGMWGMVLAPVTAQLIADAIVDSDRSATGGWLHPDRFSRN